MDKGTKKRITERTGWPYDGLEVMEEKENAKRFEMAVGDLDSDEVGSGARANKGKTQFHLVPLSVLAGTADVFAYGATKYAEWNWAKGMAFSIPYDCAQRHLNAWYFEGSDLDGESGLHHLDHAICNLLMLRHYVAQYGDTTLDDRPKWFRPSQ